MNKVLTAILIIGLVAWGTFETIANRNILKGVAAVQKQHLEDAKTIDSKTVEVDQLQEKLGQMVEVLNGSTAKLNAEKVKSARYKKQIAEFEMTQDQKADREKLVKEEPMIHRDDGALIFPRLLSAQGNTLLMNAEYRSTHGRKVVFKNGLDLFSYDVDEVHQGALIQLGIDPEQAKKNQSEMEKQSQLIAVINAKTAQAKMSQDAVFMAQQNKQNEIQAQIDEVNRQQQVKENQQQQLVDAERMRAQAAMKNANAAMVSALNGY